MYNLLCSLVHSKNIKPNLKNYKTLLLASSVHQWLGLCAHSISLGSQKSNDTWSGGMCRFASGLTVPKWHRHACPAKWLLRKQKLSCAQLPQVSVCNSSTSIKKRKFYGWGAVWAWYTGNREEGYQWWCRAERTNERTNTLMTSTRQSNEKTILCQSLVWCFPPSAAPWEAPDQGVSFLSHTTSFMAQSVLELYTGTFAKCQQRCMGTFTSAPVVHQRGHFMREVAGKN